MGMRTTRFAVSGGILWMTLALLASGAASAMTSPPDTGSLVAPRTWCGPQERITSGPAMKRSMECLIDYARWHAGLEPLERDNRLNQSAYRRAGDVVRCGVLPPHFPCGVSYLFRIEESGYLESGCWHAGENIGWGETDSRLGTARSILRAWLGSSLHRRNLLDGRFRDLGIGIRIGDVLGTRSRLWVLYLGDHSCPGETG